jgi:mediator of RNA polymerase II transcription subunit 28
MVAALNGMFSGEPPGPPPSLPGLPGQASLLQAAPNALRSSSSTLADELESSFEACPASLMSGGCVNGTDQEEIPTSVSQRIRKFLDIAKQKKIAVLCSEIREGYQRGGLRKSCWRKIL